MILSNIKLNEYLLTLEKSVTYAGIEIEKTLSWNNQIEVPAKKLSRTNEIFSKLRYYILIKTLTSNYYSLFQSYTSLKNIVKIFILQKKKKKKKRMRLSFSEFQKHTTPNFKNLTLFKFNILKLIYLS